jgi:hypothetical protein
LNGNMTRQELDLFQLTPGSLAQLRACAAKVMKRQLCHRFREAYMVLQGAWVSPNLSSRTIASAKHLCAVKLHPVMPIYGLEALGFEAGVGYP